MKLRNISGYALDIPKYGRRVGPGEIVDTDELGHDPKTDGVITGFEPVEEPKASRKPAKVDDKDKEQGK